MAKTSVPKARPLLDPEATDRFQPDMKLIRQIKEFLESAPEPSRIRFLPESQKQLEKCPNRNDIVAAVVLASGKFDLEGFGLGKKGLRWDTQPEVAAFVRPYVYFSHLLHLDADAVKFLFGQRNMNDMMMLQFDTTPETDVGMIVFRLNRFLREGNAICRL